MKTPIYIVLILLLIAACNLNTHKKESTKNPVDLKIRSCKMYSSDFVMVDPNEKGQLMQEFRFNRKGFVNELIRYGMDGEVVGRFDILGENTPFPLPGKPEFRDTAITVVDLDSLENIKGIEVKSYNSAGLLVDVKYFLGADSLIRHNTYNYDQNGLIKEDIYWDTDLDKPKQKITYEFEYFDD